MRALPTGSQPIGERALRDLDRDRTIQTSVDVTVDLAHPTPAEWRHDLVRPDAHPGCQCHGLEIIEVAEFLKFTASGGRPLLGDSVELVVFV